MKQMRNYRTAIVAALFVTILVGAGFAEEGNDPGRACSFRNTEGLYGFNCTGFFPPTTPGATALQPIGFVGYVRSDGRGRFFGPATVSLDFGSLPARVDGIATLDPERECLGRVVYDTFEIEFAPGVRQNVGPATFDFAVVDNGKEILGSATAPSATGSAVPRMACRLVKVKPQSENSDHR
jgi:hypothetical protein